MKRRILLAATVAAAVSPLSQGTQALAEPIQLPLPTGGALPSRLGMSHVHTVRVITDRLRGVAR